MNSSTETNVLQNIDQFMENQRSFFEYLRDWEAGLKELSVDEVIRESGGAEQVALISTDMLEGFCRQGPLSSERVKAIIHPVVNLLQTAREKGIHRMALCEDAHREDAEEFEAYPPHCVAGSPEAETIQEIKQLPFHEELERIPKNSIASDVDTGLAEWLTRQPLKSILVVGDCTDICVYQAAIFVRCLANQRGYSWNVIVPANAVETFDTPVKAARESGTPAHPGDLFHLVFLYHLGMNGVRIVRAIR